MYITFTYILFFFLTIWRPQRSTLFPYTTLFRSREKATIDEQKDIQTKLENLKNEAVQAERRGDLARVAEINYGTIPALEATMKRSEEHTSELQSHSDLVCRLLLEKKKQKK